RSPGGAGCAGRLGIWVVVTGCAGGLAGIGLTAPFALGLAFLGDGRRAAFFGGFFFDRTGFSDPPGLCARGYLSDAGFLALCLALAFGFLSCGHLSPPN